MKLTERLERRDEQAVVRSESAPSAPRTRGKTSARQVLTDDVFDALYMEVVDRLDTGGVVRIDPSELAERIDQLVGQTLAQRRLAIGQSGRRQIVDQITDEIVGLGPLERLLADPTVSDILVNTAERVYVERNGVLERTDVRFRSDAHLLNTINRIVARVGRRIDEASPMVDARLPDGSRINAVIPPLAVDGPLLSIRRFHNAPVSLRQLVESGSIPAAMAHYFKSAVRAKCNILVCGGTGAGKTTLLNALSRHISSRERIITIEDSAELRLQQEHVGRLEARPSNIEGQGEVTIRDLVRNALRMRPDRIIVGEVRASEVLDMIQAMNTGHEGSMTTVHANSVPDAFTRLTSMLCMAGTALSETMMLQMIARAIHVVVHVARGLDGHRYVTSVAETHGLHGGEVNVHPVFSYDHQADTSRARWRCSGHTLLADRFRTAGASLHQRYLAEYAR